jgi:hypothetical protein
MLFCLTKILGTKKLGQTDNLSAILRGLSNKVYRPIKVRFRIRPALHLDQANRCFALFRHD